MVWFFGRGSEVVRIETRIDNASGDYLVEVAKPDGAVETERFSDRDVFQQRLEAIEAQLQAQSYVQLGAEVLPPGWRGPFTN